MILNTVYFKGICNLPPTRHCEKTENFRVDRLCQTDIGYMGVIGPALSNSGLFLKLSLLFHCYLGYYSQIILKNSKTRVSGCQPNMIYSSSGPWLAV